MDVADLLSDVQALTFVFLLLMFLGIQLQLTRLSKKMDDLLKKE